jgi:OmpR-family two-component system manganese-sensing sensor histidine kinase
MMRSLPYTEWAIGLQNLIRELESAPLALERRLLGSYLAAFAVILLVAAVAVHLAFIGIIQEQTNARLYDVARAGMRSAIFNREALSIDKGDLANTALLSPDEGLQWFDLHGRLLASQGLTPRPGAQANFSSVSAPILNPITHQPAGTVTASQWNEQQRADGRYLDFGLLAGTLLAALGSAVGGLALARRAVRPVAQTFQTLREFTDNASHELRGPLTVIATSADAALRDVERDPVHDHWRFQTISDGAKQMSRLTSDLLLLAGADRSLERELFVVDLATTVRKLANQYRPRFAESAIALDASIDGPAIVYGNPDQMERVVANLLENALRYTPAGGTVSLEIERHGHEVQIAVRDTGIGIASENLERIFDRFWRADPVRSPKGSGLGLAIARALARRHGGDVSVSSRLGHGSTFVASFPIRPRAHFLQRS